MNPRVINLRSGVLFSEERKRKATRDSAVSQALVRREKVRVFLFLAFPDRHSRVAIVSRSSEKRTPDRRLPRGSINILCYLVTLRWMIVLLEQSPHQRHSCDPNSLLCCMQLELSYVTCVTNDSAGKTSLMTTEVM